MRPGDLNGARNVMWRACQLESDPLVDIEMLRACNFVCRRVVCKYTYIHMQEFMIYS